MPNVGEDKWSPGGGGGGNGAGGGGEADDDDDDDGDLIEEMSHKSSSSGGGGGGGGDGRRLLVSSFRRPQRVSCTNNSISSSTGGVGTRAAAAAAAAAASSYLEPTQAAASSSSLSKALSELTADLAEEHSTSTLAAEKLEAETAERMRLQQELGRLQRMLAKHEEDVEQLINVKKNLEKRLHDAQEEAEEQRQVVSQWKRKVTRLQGELADLKHLHEDQTGRNNILEKRQRKFDAELLSAQDEGKAERREKERVQRERDLALGDKYSLEQALQSVRLELEVKEERVLALMKELDDISASSAGDNELTALKRLKHDLELRVKEQDEEMDDMSGQLQMCEAAKTRLEMSLEQIRKEHRKEIAQLTDEMEEIRANAQKKINFLIYYNYFLFLLSSNPSSSSSALEAQLETEHDERTMLVREKHELERKLTELHTSGLASKADMSKVQALKRELKKTRALLHDAQAALDRAQKDNNPSRIIIRQLKNQV
ncbi:unnamed protein product [Notodromas monacha]|uniref:Myosin tail domain-containing protein n=1 Tax=Notodromas monacha TaxID=399045 RepID=A0A7R9BJG9_9CRUS|nr:unnamed protein product [Notodromas monacha]CAG0916346.1 unnamed protein product [Notodromas monacha]